MSAVSPRRRREVIDASEVQVSETQTPLHRLETVYRRVSESLRTASIRPSALRQVLDAWLFTLARGDRYHRGANLACHGRQPDQAARGRATQGPA